MENILKKRQYYYAVISGICASWASLCGKLSGNFSGELAFDNAAQLSLKAVFIFMMLTSNGVVWTYYVKALQCSRTTIIPTVISTASNYILSKTKWQTPFRIYCLLVYKMHPRNLIQFSGQYLNFTAVGGFLVFKESITLLWSCGMFLVIAGLALIVQNDSDNDDTNQINDKKSL